MSLKDLIPQAIEVKVGKGSLTLKPLTMMDVIKLAREYYPEMSQLMEGGIADLPKFVLKSPSFIATLIAYSCGEPDDVESAASLPFSVQLLALQGIWKASMVEEEEVGKLLVSLSQSMTRLNELLKQDVQKRLEENPGT